MDQQIPNEIERIAIRAILIQNGFNDYFADHQIWAFREAGSEIWKLVGEQLNQPYSLINQLCCDRAIEIEAGRILCNGAKIRAEDYLGLWRIATKVPLTNEELNQRGGYITITIKRQKAEFDAYVNKYSKDEKLELFKRSDCVIDGPTVTWSIKMVNMDAIQAYDQITSVYCSNSDAPGEHNMGIALHFPKVRLTSEATTSIKSLAPAALYAQLELEM